MAGLILGLLGVLREFVVTLLNAFPPPWTLQTPFWTLWGPILDPPGTILELRGPILEVPETNFQEGQKSFKISEQPIL